MDLVPSNFIDGSLNEICGNKTIFIPESNIQLAAATTSLQKYNNLLRYTSVDSVYDEAKTKIFTDYKRKNETHFWSDTAKNWYSKNDSQRWVLR